MNDNNKKPLKVCVRLENFVGSANGVWTAYRETVEALSSANKVKLIDNSVDEQADVVHFHSIGPVYIWNARKKSSRATVVTAHVIPESLIGSLVGGELWKPIGTKYLRYVYNLADLVLAVSPFVKDKLSSIGVTSTIKVLPNCVDRDKFHPSSRQREDGRKSLNLGSEEEIVMAAGQLQPRKGLEDFIEVANHLPEINFVWIGGPLYGLLSAERGKMSRIIENSPKNVHFPGVMPYEKMSQYYNAADLFFLPSFQENFPFVILEAASCGLPIMLRDIPEYSAILGDSYLKGKNVKEFIEKIKVVFDQSNEISEDYRKKSLSIAQKYDKNSYLNHLKEQYKELLFKNER